MKVTTRTPQQSLNAAYRKEKVTRAAIDRLKRELPLLLERTANAAESEENHKGHFLTFLREVWYREADCLVAPKGRIDLVIHDGPRGKDPAGVLIEAKRGANQAEMFHPDRPDCQALRELVLYFLRERQAGNTGVKTLMITNVDEVYLFADREFERLFWEKIRFRKAVLDADADPGKTNATAYEIIGRHLAAPDDTLTCTVVHLPLFRSACTDGDPATDDRLLPLYKILSPVHLLRRPFAGDSNTLDKGFYRELLHLIGLEEVGVDGKGRVKKSGGKKIIRRPPEGRRNPASLLENTLQVATKENRFRHVSNWSSFGADDEERRFAVALELCLTWVNRVLFLKLLETQLGGYHAGPPAPGGGGRDTPRFLTPRLIPDYDALNTLFFDVLNRPRAEREPIVAAFDHVPYLNSSLFEISELEDQVIRVNSLKDQFELPLYERSVLPASGPSPAGRGALPPLRYLFAFLDAYDFGGEGKARIQEDNKRLINASVLGLVFEKINGYRDGSFYTPGFITEYMCRQTIRRAVVQKFRAAGGLFAACDSETYDDLRSYLRREGYKKDVRLAANALVNTLTVCDPAVGSGHFLVSALNELIATKSDLGILGADAGVKEVDVRVVVENDELLVSYRRDGEAFEYQVNTDVDGNIRVAPEIQLVQRTLFEEKRTLIENCLFGVDLNPNSVKICRLRLWIELLKNAYYKIDERVTTDLQTLPNIDINIKQGNSLISRVALDQPLGRVMQQANITVARYKETVNEYFRAKSREDKRPYDEAIKKIKSAYRTFLAGESSLAKRIRKEENEFYLRYESETLFGEDPDQQRMSARERKEYQRRKASLATLKAEAQALENNTVYDQAFEWRFEFPAVLDAEGQFKGFDVVVGNPPYVRQEELTDIKPYLREHYEVYAGTADLLVYFIELSMKNLTEGGQFSFIISNKFMRAGFGRALRRYVPRFRIHELIDFGDLPVFDEATTYPLIISLEKSEPTGTFRAANLQEMGRENFRAHLAENTFASLQAGLTEEGWNLADVKTQRLLKKLKNTGVPLGEYVNGEIYYGIKTGFNEAFVIDEATRTRLVAEDPGSAEVIKPFLAGRDVKRYVPPVAEKYLILFPKGWTKSQFGNLSEDDAFNRLSDKYPAIAQWIEPHAVAARKRYDKGDYYWELRACDYYEEFEKPKIFYQEIMTYQSFTYDDAGQCSNNKLFIIPDGSFELLGLLNSNVIWKLLKSTATSYNGGALGMQSPFVLALPVADGIKDNARVTSLVTQILTAKRNNPTADTTALEAEIDVLVYKLYDLTYDEVLVVEPDFNLGREAYEEMEIA